MLNFKEMAVPQSASAVFSAYASFATTMMLVKIIIEENCGFSPNQIFQAAEVYLRTKISPSTETLKAHKTSRQKKITLSIDKGQEIVDHFDNIRLQWRFVCSHDEQNGGGNKEKRHFELVFPKKFRDRVVESYLPYVLKRAKEIKEEDKVVKIFSQECQYDEDGGSGNWGSINLDHPSTFETLAMDPDLKQSIIDDLDRFVNRREFYKKVGKAWKRGYLLYGPPGTGKSSLIAAMANYLKFDIYDLDLSYIYSNGDLRRVLLSTTNRSILVIEDIDCSVEIQNRENEEHYDQSNGKFTLSGMLNFIDGLWSSCGDERIIIFTTNHKERLDPALLRPGRMDVHINMSYCTPHGFRVLVTNYLGEEADKHDLCREIEELIGEMEVSPAEIAEALLKNDDADVVLQSLVEFLKCKREEQRKKEEETAASEKNEEEEEEEEEEEPKRKRHKRGVRLRIGRGRGRGRVRGLM